MRMVKWSISDAFTCAGPYAVLVMLGIKRAETETIVVKMKEKQ